APWTTLSRLLMQTPLLLGVVIAGVYFVLREFVSRRAVAISWAGVLPEFVLLLGALISLWINPTPYPYNLLLLVPFAFIFVTKYGAGIWKELWSASSLRPLIVGIVAFAHLIPFSVATARHLDRLNWRQERLMALAEDLTLPPDPVFDGIGMVPTRRAVH